MSKQESKLQRAIGVISIAASQCVRIRGRVITQRFNTADKVWFWVIAESPYPLF
jgi:hypothetical protein